MNTALIVLNTTFLAQANIPNPASNPGPSGPIQLLELVQRLISISVSFAFLLLTIMLFWGGIKYLMSGGDPKKLGEAHQTMTWSLLGILFLVLAWLVLKLIENFSGVPVTQFCIGFKPLPTACP